LSKRLVAICNLCFNKAKNFIKYNEKNQKYKGNNFTMNLSDFTEEKDIVKNKKPIEDLK